jgi:hypothetical protein
MRMARTATRHSRPQDPGPDSGENASPSGPVSLARPATLIGALIGAGRRGVRAAREWPRLALPAARRHWLMTALLAGGVALRVISQIAYRPALLYIDTLKYLYNAWPGTDPLGYKGVLQVILFFGNLQTVVAVQHLAGLAMGVAIYVLLLRRGVWRWLAAVAAAPVLLDAYELQMEQTIMPDAWFEVLLVAGLVVLLWQPRLSLRSIVGGGILFGLSATVWQGGEFLIVPAVIFAVIASAIAGWRYRARAGALMCAAFALPILLYMTGSLVFSGHFWLSRTGESSLYGRVAAAADCATLKLPSYERALCPTAQQKALGPDGLDHDASSPLNRYVAPPNVSQSAAVSGFIHAVVTQQPLRVLSSYAADAGRLFEVTRVTSPGDTPISRWQFQDSYPSYQNYIRTNRENVIILGWPQDPPKDYLYQPLDPSLGGRAQVIAPLAKFLRAYQLDGGFTPGPLYLVATVAGLLGTVLLVRRRRNAQDAVQDVEAGAGTAGAGTVHRDLAFACCLFFITPVVLLLASDLPEFSWRYQLPAIVTLPPAGALGIAVIVTRLRARPGRRPPAGPADDLVSAATDQAT